MLNDATCFKAVYIVCRHTDLRSGMGRLAALVEAQTGSRPYVPDTFYLFCGRRTDRIKGLVWEGNGWLLLYKRLSESRLTMAAQPGGGTFPDAAAVPLVNGRADGHPEEVRRPVKPPEHIG